MCIFISVEFEWKIGGLRKPPSTTTAAYLSNAILTALWLKSAASQGFELEITLLKQNGQASGPLKGYSYREDMLKDAAFLPKNFVITLRRGAF